MSDAKPKRPGRGAKSNDVSPSDPTPIETAAPMMPEDPPAPGFVSPPPPLAEPAPETIASAAAAVTQPVLAIASAGAAAQADSVQDVWTALAEAQAALARGFEEIVIEASGIARSSLAATADATLALLAARTVPEAVEINVALARRGVEAMVEGSARLSEIAAKAVSDASRPVLSRLGDGWNSAAV